MFFYVLVLDPSLLVLWFRGGKGGGGGAYILSQGPGFLATALAVEQANRKGEALKATVDMLSEFSSKFFVKQKFRVAGSC